MEDHCLALLSYVSKHRHEPQSYQILEDETGVPVGTIKALIHFHREHGTRNCYLCMASQKYRYSFKVYPEGADKVMDAVWLGYG